MTSASPREWLVLDSFAVIAYWRDEPGAVEVEDLLRQAATQGSPRLAISCVNLGEVFYRIVRLRHERIAERFLTDFELYPVSVFDVDTPLAAGAARIKGRFSLSNADCIAAALAQRLDAAVVTGDPEFRKIEHLIDVHWLPR